MRRRRAAFADGGGGEKKKLKWGNVSQTSGFSLSCCYFWVLTAVGHQGRVAPVQSFVYIGAVTAEAESCWSICADAPLNQELRISFEIAYTLDESLLAFVLTDINIYFNVQLRML